MESKVDRPVWAEEWRGEILGDRWSLSGGDAEASPWAVVWDSDTGEVVAVQVLSPTTAGRFVPVGSVPRHPDRWGPAVPDVIERARVEDGTIVYLAGVISGMSDAWVSHFLREAEDYEHDESGRGPGKG